MKVGLPTFFVRTHMNDEIRTIRSEEIMIYLDHVATTYVYEEAVALMSKIMLEDFGNPSSMHQMGINAERYITDAKEAIAKILKVTRDEIYVTSGGTESNNLAIFGIAKAYKRTGMHIITTEIEHAATLEAYKALEEEGFTIEYVPVDQKGFIDIDVLKNMVTDQTILVSMIHVNNEIGCIQDVGAITKAIKAVNPETKVHFDGVQSFCKVPISLKQVGIDAYSFSGHKIHGPKGSGGLFIKKGVRVKPLIYGGAQQKNMRSGTENVPGVAGMALAARELYGNRITFMDNTKVVKDYMIKGLSALEDVVINSGDAGFVPYILNVSFIGVRGEVLLHALEDQEIYVSTGSACASNKNKVSKVLTGIGLTGDALEGGVRFSFDMTTTCQDIDVVLGALYKLVPMLRKFKRK